MRELKGHYSKHLDLLISNEWLGYLECKVFGGSFQAFQGSSKP